MKARFILALMLMLVVMTAFATTVNAQTVCDFTDVTPLSGAAGSTVTASGGDIAGSVTVLWDGIDIATIPNGGSAGVFSGNFTVPADAAPGSHAVTLSMPDEEIECPFTFTVVASVQPVADEPAPAKPLVLPSTGFFMLIPASGLVAAYAGIALLRRRGNR